MLHKIRRIWIQFSRNRLKFTQNFTFQNFENLDTESDGLSKDQLMILNTNAKV